MIILEAITSERGPAMRALRAQRLTARPVSGGLVGMASLTPRFLALAALLASCRTGLPIDGVEGGGGEGAGGSPFCGDGKITGSEECDGADLGGLDCTDLGFGNPEGLSCSETCLLIDDCAPVCGNLVLEAGEGCDDGNTVSGDGCSADCFVEEDMCEVATEVTLDLGAISIFGTLGGSGNHVPLPTDACPAGAGAGPEHVYEVSVNIQGHVTAYLPSNGTNFDTILYSRTSCGAQGSEITCHDNDAGAGAGEVITAWLEPGEVVYFIVDTGGAAIGDYELVLDLSRGGLCGDHVPITVEGSRPIELSGRISSLANDANASGCNGEGLGPDAVYGFTFTESGTYQLDLQTNAFDSIAYARTSCEDPASEVACNSPGGTDDSSVTIPGGAGQTRFLWVDSVDFGAGPYSVRVTH